MIRVAVLVAALALPALCRADQVWRWEDSAGRLHYSNVPEHVPPHAEPLRGAIGTIKTQPPPKTAPAERTRPTPLTEPSSLAPHPRQNRHAASGCCGLGYPFGLALSSTDPSELVKQVSVLGALGVRWRNGGCD